MSTNARSSMPGSRPVQPTRFDQMRPQHRRHCSVWPWVNSRSNWPSVADAYTPPNTRSMPPERITSRSSMHSAPAAIPAMIEVIFPAGFTPADATRDDLNPTRSAISPDSPARSARPITGTRPACDTMFASSKTGVARDHSCGSFTGSAFSVRQDQDLDNPDSSHPEGTFT